MEEQKKLITAGKMVLKISLRSFLYQILLGLLTGFILGFLLAFVGETIASILTILASIGITIISYKSAVKTTLKKNTILAENINKIIKIFTVLLIIMIVANIISNIFNMVAYSTSLPKAIEIVENNTLYTSAQKAELISKAKTSLTVKVITNIISSIINICINIWVIKYIKQQLIENIPGAKTMQTTEEGKNMDKQEKNKNIEAIIVIVLIVLLLAVLVFFGIKIFVDSSEQNLNNPNNDIDEIEKPNNDETNVNNGAEEPDDKAEEGNDVEEETDDKEEKTTIISSTLGEKDVFFVTEAIANKDNTYTLNGVIYEHDDENYNESEITDRWKLTKKYATITVSKDLSCNMKYDYDNKYNTVEDVFKNYKKATPENTANPSYEHCFTFVFKNGKCVGIENVLTGTGNGTNTTIDPYANYSKMTWASTKAEAKNGKIDYDRICYIENGKVYVKSSTNKYQVKGISGTPIKVIFDPDTQGATFNILTSVGKVYVVYDWMGKDAELFADMSKYNAIDMTYIYNYTTESIYFLTSDGKLIDRNGTSYDKYNFVAEQRFVVYDDSQPDATEFWVEMRFDKEGHGYRYNGSKNTYTKLTYGGKDLVLSKIFTYDIGGCLVIITEDNRMFELYDSTTPTNVKNNVKDVNIVAGNCLLITFTDGTTKHYELDATEGYDVKTHKAAVLKVKYDKTSDLIKDLAYKVNPLKKGDFELNMVLPYFKVQTAVTEGINSQIKELYENYLDAYSSDESLKITGRNTKISYTANMDKSTGILTLKVKVAYSDWQGTGAESGSSTITFKYDYINDKDKTDVKDISTLASIISQFGRPAIEMPSGMINLVTGAYDAKTLTGTDVISAAQLYQDSDWVSVKIVVSKDKQYETGKYSVKISDNVLKTLTSVKKDGIFVSPTQTSGYVASRKDSLDKIKGEGGVDKTQTYYSYIMKDESTEKVIGVVFVRKGAMN